MKKIYEEIKIEFFILSLDIVTLSDNEKDDIADDTLRPIMVAKKDKRVAHGYFYPCVAR